MSIVGTAPRPIQHLLAQADIQLGGTRPWDLHIHSRRFFDRVLARGSLGLGEAYVDGDWEVQQLDDFFYRVLRARLNRQLRPWRLLGHRLKSKWLNRQNARRAWQVGEEHYDLDNEFYRAMLDPRMTYSCGYWSDAHDLASAQEAKLDLICRKLGLEPGMKVLDIGCGWGSFMSYAAEHYGVTCTGVTISREQHELVRQRYRHLPIDCQLLDYRDLEARYDRVVSVGMFEHVGQHNYREFMQVARRCLNPDGIFLLHTIGKDQIEGATDAWIDRYIFPNGQIPALPRLAESLCGVFVIEDLHNFGADYDRTLMAWYDNFREHWPRFRNRLGEAFFRKWEYYLLSCAGAFRARNLQLWQWVLSPEGLEGGYRRPL
jgi:cyclopropane-fatty-acyl-phospholipid synthase